MQRVRLGPPRARPAHLLCCRRFLSSPNTPPSPPPNPPPNPPPKEPSNILFITGFTALFFSAKYYYDRQLAPGRAGVLDPSRFVLLTLKEVTPLTHDTSLFRFELRSPVPPFPVTSSVHVKDDTMQIMRPYTPINDPVEDKRIDLVVKKYKEGTMSRFLHAKKAGDKVEVRGPVRELEYKENMAAEIGLIAGGTGITPIYQLVRHILSTPADRTRITILYASRSEPDILLRTELDALQRQHPDRLRVYHTIEEVVPGWQGGKGRVTEEMIKEWMPKPGREGGVLVAVCGPDGMVQHVAGDKARDLSQGSVGGLLKRIGYTEKEVWKY